MAKDHLSTEELELIEAIRNVRRAYPNGYDELLYYAQQLFDKLVEMPPVDEWSSEPRHGRRGSLNDLF